MNDWVTVASFNYAHQAELLKGRIESEGITCNLKDELTATANPFYSNAIGGVKVQVRQDDVEKTIPILKELGYTIDNDENYNVEVKRIVKFTERIPFIKKLPLERRYTILILLLALVLGIVITGFYFATNPGLTKRLAGSNWCVSQVVFNGNNYRPYSTGVKIVTLGCNETMSFSSSANLPGINCPAVSAEWYLRNDSLIMTNADNLQQVYNGAYKVDISNRGEIILRSASTTIYGTKSNW
jgi:hypothetical protein